MCRTECIRYGFKVFFRLSVSFLLLFFITGCAKTKLLTGLNGHFSKNKNITIEKFNVIPANVVAGESLKLIFEYYTKGFKNGVSIDIGIQLFCDDISDFSTNLDTVKTETGFLHHKLKKKDYSFTIPNDVKRGKWEIKLVLSCENIKTEKKVVFTVIDPASPK